MKARSSPRTKQSPPLTAVDLFCGAGGLSYAFHRAGFRIVLAVERDKDAADSYDASFIRRYSPGTELLRCDIRERRISERLAQLGEGSSPIDVMIGGPPCQDFSPARLKVRRNGQRAGLVRHYFDIMRILQPRAFLFENVPGLKTAREGLYWKVVEAMARDLGYHVSSAELNAESFGVPQRRRRLFVVGTKTTLGPYVFPTGEERAPSVMATIGKLRALAAGEKDLDDDMHRARAHRPHIVKYMSYIKQGQSWRDATHVRVLECHKDHTGHYDVYGRIVGTEIAPTITGGCTNPSRGRFIHPEQHRGLTVREAALLQTFPADWRFLGGIESGSQQVGNAVPVKLGEALARSLSATLTPS